MNNRTTTPPPREAPEALFARLTREYLGPLRRLCHAYEFSEARREELLQEILLALWQSLPSFKGDASLRTWTFKVAHNVASRFAARGALERRQDEAPAEWIHARESAPQDAQLESAWLRSVFNAEIARLKPLDRQVIVLYMEELPQAEIAEITGLSQEAVSTRVYRIKDTLTKEVNRRLR